MEHDDALFFLDKIKTNYQLISQTKLPIIEFAFEDIREVLKRQKKIEKIQQVQHQKKQELKEKVSKEDVEKKQKDRKNKEALAKIKIQEIIDSKDPQKLSQVKQYIGMVKARGLKQRLKKAIRNQFGTQTQEANSRSASQVKLNKANRDASTSANGKDEKQGGKNAKKQEAKFKERGTKNRQEMGIDDDDDGDDGGQLTENRYMKMKED